MSDAVMMPSIPIELDEAFRRAVVSSWGDLAKHAEPRAIRVEYLCEAGTSLDELGVWSSKVRGYWDLVCDYSNAISSGRSCRVRFVSPYSSEKLSHMLDFIMKNQNQFTRPADASAHGLVLVYPAEPNARAEADTLRGGMAVTSLRFGDARAEGSFT